MMRIVFFVHSVVSDWNHGNAHFLRGLMDALTQSGHDVVSYEPSTAWSVRNLVTEEGVGPVIRALAELPGITVRVYDPLDAELPDTLADAVQGADAIVVHEWTDPRVTGVLTHLRRIRDIPLLLHDTHHRALSDPAAVLALGPDTFDGVLAFGRVLRDVYRDTFGVEQVWTFHEAADVRRFRPLRRPRTQDVVWIGNWGDGERTDELRHFWIDAARALPDLQFTAYGVRYPRFARAELQAAGVRYEGWVESLRVPEVFAESAVTLHVPRRLYRERLHGIPTIRVFEALACGIPLISAPWRDAESLFGPDDFTLVCTPAEMQDAIRNLVARPDEAARQAERGLATIRARHTCDHRAAQLLDILATVGAAGADVRRPDPEEAACA